MTLNYDADRCAGSENFASTPSPRPKCGSNFWPDYAQRCCNSTPALPWIVSINLNYQRPPMRGRSSASGWAQVRMCVSNMLPPMPAGCQACQSASAHGPSDASGGICKQDTRHLKVRAVLGDACEVAVTDGDTVAAQIKPGFSVNTRALAIRCR